MVGLQHPFVVFILFVDVKSGLKDGDIILWGVFLVNGILILFFLLVFPEFREYDGLLGDVLLH